MIETLILILVIIIIFLYCYDIPEHFNSNNDVLFDEIDKCQDNDAALKEASGGMCNNCQEARELYDRLGKKYSDSIGFGSLYSFCPVSLGAMNQSCLQKIITTTNDRLSKNNNQIQEIIQDISDYKTSPISSYVDQLATNIDTKINQDYVKLFLDYHQKALNDTYNFRYSSDANISMNNVNIKLDDLRDKISSKSAQQDAIDLNLQNAKNFSIYHGNYNFDMSQVAGEISNHNYVLTDKDKKDISASVINISKTNISIRNGSQTVQTFVFNYIVETINPYSSTLRAFKLSNQTENFEVYPTSSSEIYINVINSNNTVNTGFLSGVKYLAVRL